jgi:hypothetical protein
MTTSDTIAAMSTRPLRVLWIAAVLPFFRLYRRYIPGRSNASVKHVMIR